MPLFCWLLCAAWVLGIRFFACTRWVPALLFTTSVLGLSWWCIVDSENLFSFWKIFTAVGLFGVIPLILGLALMDPLVHD